MSLAKSFLVTIALTALILAGCATVGQVFPDAAVKDIVIGQTTKTTIEKMFGQPWRTGLENGTETWTYGHYRYSVFKKTQSRDLVVRFNKNGLVESYAYSATPK
ncbi:MAG: outer membrane protein assembly factor BamE [Proteobacteria bacterium]|nr:outer membrane protein assembly factor BamE [Pseudomonadota bacterium]MBU1641654.1 outer membrane protein assembly factor BamE [Pseudomonadota bacterium]